MTSYGYAADLNNTLLKGSPYCFPQDDAGDRRAKELLDVMLKVRRHQQAAAEAFTNNLAEVRNDLEQTLDIQLVFESNAIEQVPTSFEETREIILANPASDDFVSAYTFGQGVRADAKVMEVIGHRDAVLLARRLASSYSGHITEGDVRNIHKMVMSSEPRIAGHYKRYENKISGRGGFLTSRPESVSNDVRILVDWMNGPGAAHTGPHVAAVVHAWISDIHPFEDGNGRVARILANLVLFRMNWPCLIIPSDSRIEYYDALAASDGSDILPLASLFARSLERVLIEMADPAYARQLIEADIRTIDRYTRWLGAISRFADQLQRALHRWSLTLEQVGVPGRTGFQLLCDRRAAGNCWFAKVRRSDGGAGALLWFGFQSEPMLDWAGTSEVTFPSIFISERSDDPGFPHPYRPLWQDPRLGVHEIVVMPRKSRAVGRIRRGADVREERLEDGADAVAIALRELL